LDDLLQKLQTTISIERTEVIDFKMCCLYVVLDLLGSVETQLELSGKFYYLFVEYFFLFPLVQKVYKSTKKSHSYNRKQSDTFLWFTVYINVLSN